MKGKIGLLVLIFISLSIHFCAASNSTTWTLIDENLEVTIVIEGINIKEANNRIDAILIDPNGELQANINIKSLSDTPIDLEEFKVSALWADIKVFSSTENLETTLHPNSTLIATQTFDLNDYIVLEDTSMISGIYKFRYDLEYTKNSDSEKIVGNQFYMKIDGNPLLTVTGAASTVAVVTSAVSLIWLGNTIRTSASLDLRESIDSSFAAPTNKLLGFYKGKAYKSVQNEIVSAIYGRVVTWRRQKCPKCKAIWPEGEEVCPECGITLEEAEQLFNESLENKCTEACKELVDSVSGKSVYSISESLADDIIPATSILSVLTNSGLSLIKPRVSTRMSKKTQRLVFTSLSTAIVTVLWVQSIGLEAISLTMLVIALLTGTIPALIIRRTLQLGIKQKILDTFQQGESS
jgi:hypothetical protein